MEKKVYTEVQRFRQWWMWAIILLVDAGLVVSFVLDKVYGSAEPVQWWEYLLILLVSAGLTVLFLTLNLYSRIDEEGIHVRFYPFHLRERHYPWRDISKVYVREYSPIWEYGGWGIKYGSGGKAYNVSGKEGIQIVLTNGDKVLIGTNQSKMAEQVLFEHGFGKK